MSIYPELIFEQIKIGPMENFIYIIGDLGTKEVGIVDPAWDVDFIEQHVASKGFHISHLLLTHGHPDHINGVDLFQQQALKVIISKHEPNMFLPSMDGFSKVGDGDLVTIGNITIECLHTPGHSPGGQCFRYKDILITGDTLFIDGCGRCDLPGGDARMMCKSLTEKIKPLPDSTLIFPGHDYGNVRSATLKSQKKTNPYLSAPDLDAFLQKRMGVSI